MSQTTAPASAAPASQDSTAIDLDALTAEVLGEDIAATAAATDDDEVDAALDAVLGSEAKDEATKGEPAAKPADEQAAEAQATEVKVAGEQSAAEAKPADEAKGEEKVEAKGEAKGERPFKVFAADGSEAGEVPAVEIEYKAAGKVRRDSVEQLVRLAQRGVHNDELYAEVEEARTFLEREVPQIRQQVAEYEETIDVLRETLREIVVEQNDTRLFELREKAAAQNSPEAELQRLRTENERLRTGTKQMTAAHGIKEIISHDVVPALLSVAEEYPSVSVEEAQARFVALVKPYVTDGVVPPEKLPNVTRAIAQVRGWAEGAHESRTAARTEQERLKAEQDALNAKAAKAQAELVAAKRAVARATAPTTGGTPASGDGIGALDAPRKRAPVTADDMIEDILDEAFA